MNTPLKNFIRFAAALILLAVVFIIHSCKKEIGINNNDVSPADPTILDAKSWYNGAYPVIANNGKSTNSLSNSYDLSQRIKPDWVHPSNYKRFNQDVIELPLDPLNKFAAALLNNATKQLPYTKKSTKASFLLLKDSSGYKAYIMIVMADSAYLKGNYTKLANNTYSIRDADFSGMVMYLTPKGSFVGGYRYINGKLIKPGSSSVLKGTNSIIKPNYAPAECWDYWLVSYDQNGNEDGREYLFTDCEGGGTDDSGSTGDSGAGGGSPYNSPPECHTTNSIKKVTINKAPTDPGTGVVGDPNSPTDPGTGFPQPPSNDGCPVNTSPSVITTDTSITNNSKVNCLLNLLLKNNTKFDSLINAFKGNTYNITFKIGNTQNNANGQTVHSTTDFAIVLNRSFVGSHSQIEVAKTLLHEAFHANLSQRAYAIFGTNEISKWPQRPEDMTLQELVNKIDQTIANDSQLQQIEHEYMAENINVIANGLRELLSESGNGSDFNYDNYLGLAFQGLTNTNFYKDFTNGKSIEFLGRDYSLSDYYNNEAIALITTSQINCP